MISKVKKIDLSNGKISASVITYGGTLISLKVPDKSGKLTEVMLSCKDLEGYIKQDKFLGALIGPYANRIGGAVFSLNGKKYQLEANDGTNTLHGAGAGFGLKNWDIVYSEETKLCLGLTHIDGEGGFPGNIDVKVTYSLEGSALEICYEAESDKDTICNLTSHGYFNLSGESKNTILDHKIRIYADKYTPTDSASIPTGEIAEVKGTPLDLREFTPIGKNIDSDFEQMKWAGGFDHNFVINGEAGKLRKAADVYCESTGIKLSFSTDQPGMQFYSGNYLGGEFVKRSAFCLESQAFPDSPNKPDFPSCVLKKGEKYIHKAEFLFTIQK